ncbi:MAG: AsmA family protein, partial [Burkholderiaceae bacterium]|nr:AsmA family protein [Burkholderiaceae bacterium]
MKTLKIIAGLIGLLVILAVAGTAYVAATFDPDTQRARIIELVKEKTGRQLRIDGDFKLTFFPRLGVVLGGVALSDQPAPAARAQAGAKPGQFLQVDSARASLRIMPLLTGRFAADRVVLSGLSGEFVRRRDGSTNFDDLLGTPSDSGKKASDAADESSAALAIPAVDVAGLEISGANIGWRDERNGSAIRLRDLSVQTGRIAAAVPGQLSVRTRIESSQPALALQAELLTNYIFDPATRSLNLTGFTAQLRGDAPGLSGLDLNFSSIEAHFDGAARRADLKMLRLVARDAAGLTATMTMPRLSVAPGLLEGEPAALAVQIERPGRKLMAQVSLSAPLMRAGKLAFEELTGKLQVSGPDLPSAGVALDFAGNAGLDWGKELGNAQLSARLDESTLKAKLRSRGFSPIVLDVEVNVDRIDLDRYFPAQSATTSDKAPADTPIDLRALA